MLDPSRAPARVLLVEDEILIQMLAAENLEELGLAVEIASSAADARRNERLLRGEVECAIVDLGLPDENGDALVRELRTTYPKLPIVVASGHDEATLRDLFKGEGHMGYLSKPYTFDELRTVLLSVGLIG